MAKTKRTEAAARKASTQTNASGVRPKAKKASSVGRKSDPAVNSTKQARRANPQRKPNAAKASAGSTGRSIVAAPRPRVAARAASERRKTEAKALRKETGSTDPHQLVHGLNELLHTMQAIQQHEEALCSLMHAIRRGRASSGLLRDLRTALAELPAHDYLHEVEQLRELAG